jgi:hypothetical protein
MQTFIMIRYSSRTHMNRDPARNLPIGPNRSSQHMRQVMERYRLVRPRVAVVLGAARPASQRHMAHAPALAPGLACWFAGARQLGDFPRHTASKRMPYGQHSGFIRELWCKHPMMMP